MIPRLLLTFTSHFLQLQLVWCYIDPSFRLFLFPFESQNKLKIITNTLFLSFHSVPRTHAQSELISLFKDTVQGARAKVRHYHPNFFVRF